jgi:hypothetical protein
MKFLTKLIVAGAPGTVAKTYRMDFEADSAEGAADLATDYWRANWSGPEAVTETVIHVHQYLPDLNEINEEVAFSVILSGPAKRGE